VTFEVMPAVTKNIKGLLKSNIVQPGRNLELRRRKFLLPSFGVTFIHWRRKQYVLFFTDHTVSHSNTVSLQRALPFCDIILKLHSHFKCSCSCHP